MLRSLKAELLQQNYDKKRRKYVNYSEMLCVGV